MLPNGGQKMHEEERGNMQPLTGKETRRDRRRGRRPLRERETVMQVLSAPNTTRTAVLCRCCCSSGWCARLFCVDAMDRVPARRCGWCQREGGKSEWLLYVWRLFDRETNEDEG